LYFIEWADKEMSAYEKRLTEHLQQMEERRLADNDRVEKLIEIKCKKHYDQLRRELGLGRNNGMMFWATILVIILLLVFYFSGYSGSSGTIFMLE
jgi:hypothetical protein